MGFSSKADGMLVPINGKITMRKMKSYVFVINVFVNQLSL
jgi:hypothetical protein